MPFYINALLLYLIGARTPLVIYNKINKAIDEIFP